jgi:hypothetical protein
MAALFFLIVKGKLKTPCRLKIENDLCGWSYDESGFFHTSKNGDLICKPLLYDESLFELMPIIFNCQYLVLKTNSKLGNDNIFVKNDSENNK